MACIFKLVLVIVLFSFLTECASKDFQVHHKRLHKTRANLVNGSNSPPEPVKHSIAGTRFIDHQYDPTPWVTDDFDYCPATNGSIHTSQTGQLYRVACHVDFNGVDFRIDRYIPSFSQCVDHCVRMNLVSSSSVCAGVIYKKGSHSIDDECHIKNSIGNMSSSTIRCNGAILLDNALWSPGELPVLSAKDITPVSKGSLVVPSIAQTSLHGPSMNKPSTQYIQSVYTSPLLLAQNDYAVGVDLSLTVNYPISDNTGVLSLNSNSQARLAPIENIPHLSRDGGKGGILAGQHLFIFSDTGSYSSVSNSDQEGSFLGLVSSSVATAVGGGEGNPIALQDGIGEWSDNLGRMRGFVPLSQGEESYNLRMQGQGQRYAIWPESSPIPLDGNSAVLYAPIVYDNVNMDTRAAVFTYTGTTVLTITAGNPGGPSAHRTVKRLFNEGEVEWGCAGGIRSWGAMGPGGSDGRVYLFGNVDSGLLLARVNATDINDRDSYEYWTGSDWDTEMPSSASTALAISGSFMDVDMFYSPRHSTFIIVYMTNYADSTFYYRYLKTPEAILPLYSGGGSDLDYVENIVHNEWSDERVLYRASPGLNGKYIYAGGVHQGYYGDDDISNGGSRMLLSWTAPTGQDPGSALSEYQIMTGEVNWA